MNRNLIPSIRVAAKVAAAVVAAVGVFAVCSPSKADDVSSNVGSQKFIAALRGGVHFNQNKAVKDAYGSVAGFGGLAYTIQSEPLVNRLSLAVDYITVSSKGNTQRIIPVMLEYQAYQGMHSHTRPYVSFGCGLVNIKAKDTLKGVDGTGSTFGAFLGYGIDMPSQVFVEARYLLVPELMTENMSGPSVLVGIRF
ncbi:MAG TPA: hypothetical protein VGK19_14930 [Capsulimonadaceae bacterium]|jgi:hypothetical protein